MKAISTPLGNVAAKNDGAVGRKMILRLASEFLPISVDKCELHKYLMKYLQVPSNPDQTWHSSGNKGLPQLSGRRYSKVTYSRSPLHLAFYLPPQ